MLEEERGLCFSYLFCSIIITSVLHQWPNTLVDEVMVSGLNLFQNPSFVVVTLSTAMEVLTLEPKANIVYSGCNVEHAEHNVIDLRCKVILLEWLLTLLLERIKR